jgi:hypothetical protein
VWPESKGHISTALVEFVSLTFASWNQIVLWLRTLDTFRPDA